MKRRQCLFERVGREMDEEKIFYEEQLPTIQWTEDSRYRVERISPVQKSPTLPRKHLESGGDGAEFKKVGGAPRVGVGIIGDLVSSKRSPGTRTAPLESFKVEPAPEVQLPQWRVVSEAVDPLMFMFCLYGVLPLAFKPPRVSLHPIRSTLLYAIAVFILVTWCVGLTVQARTGVLLAASECMDRRIMAMQALAHVAAHIFVPIAWLEAKALRDRPKQWDTFASSYGHLVSSRLPAKTRIISRCMAFLVLIVLPVTVATAWILTQPHVGAQPAHVLAHTHVTSVCLLMCSLFAVGCRAINDLARDCSNRLQQMIAEKRATAEGVAEFRNAWLSLRQLLASAGGLSIGALLFLLYLLVLITLSMYQFLAALASARWFLAAGLSSLCLLYFFQLLVMCDAAHRATATMQLSFASSLTSLQMYKLDYDLRSEVQHFLNVLVATPAGVWVAGFVQVNRQLMGSMMAAMVTYLVVLLQFRQSDEKMDCPLINATTVNSMLENNLE